MSMLDSLMSKYGYFKTLFLVYLFVCELILYILPLEQ